MIWMIDDHGVFIIRVRVWSIITILNLRDTMLWQAVPDDLNDWWSWCFCHQGQGVKHNHHFKYQRLDHIQRHWNLLVSNCFKNKEQRYPLSQTQAMRTFGANMFGITAPGMYKLYSKWSKVISFTIPCCLCGYQAGRALK